MMSLKMSRGSCREKKNLGILVLAQRKLSRVFIKSTLLSLVEKVTSALLFILYQLNTKHCKSKAICKHRQTRKEKAYIW